MQVISSGKKRIELVFLLSLVGLTIFLGEGHIRFLSDPDALASLIGPYGYIGVICAQFFQVMLAPMPAITPVVSGMLYGTVLGTMLSFVGASIGSLAAILIGRKYGRPAVKKFLSKDVLNKFDRYTSGHGYLPFVILFVFPGFPDDALCFIAGLTDLDWRKLTLIASFGRIPGIALLAMTGSSAAKANLPLFVLSASAILAMGVISVKYERSIEKMIVDIEEEGLTAYRAVKNLGGSIR